MGNNSQSLHTTLLAKVLPLGRERGMYDITAISSEVQGVNSCGLLQLYNTKLTLCVALQCLGIMVWVNTALVVVATYSIPHDTAEQSWFTCYMLVVSIIGLWLRTKRKSAPCKVVDVPCKKINSYQCAGKSSGRQVCVL